MLNTLETNLKNSTALPDTGAGNTTNAPAAEVTEVADAATPNGEETAEGVKPDDVVGEAQSLAPLPIRDLALDPRELVDRLGGRLVSDIVEDQIAKALEGLHPDDAEDIAAELRDDPTTDALDRFVAPVAAWIVQKAVSREHTRDAVIQSLSELNSSASAVPKMCGPLLATAVGFQLNQHPDFTVLAEVKIPLAKKAIDRAANERRKLKRTKTRKGRAVSSTASCVSDALRFAPDHAEDGVCIKADLIAIDRRLGTLWILESKRGGGHSDSAALSKLSDKLHAAKMCAHTWFEQLGIEGLSEVRIGALDHLGRCGAEARIAIAGGTFDRTFGVSGLDEATDRVHAALAFEAHLGLRDMVRNTAAAFGFVVLDPESVDDTAPPLVTGAGANDNGNGNGGRAAAA